MKRTSGLSRLAAAWLLFAAGVAACAHSKPMPTPAGTPLATELVPTGELLYPVNPGVRPGSQACVDQVQSYGASQPDWAESYVIGFRIVANFTENAAAHVEALRDLVARDCAVFVRVVRLSSAQGRALQEQIENDLASLRAAGVEVNGVAFDPVKDRVTVGVTSVTDQVRAELARRYPIDLLTIEEMSAPVPA